MEVGDGQGGLACCGPWGHKGLDMTEWLHWTELNWTEYPRLLPDIDFGDHRGIEKRIWSRDLNCPAPTNNYLQEFEQIFLFLFELQFSYGKTLLAYKPSVFWDGLLCSSGLILGQHINTKANRILLFREWAPWISVYLIYLYTNCVGLSE